MHCENCGRLLPERSDPLRVPSLHELRAGPAQVGNENTVRHTAPMAVAPDR